MSSIENILGRERVITALGITAFVGLSWYYLWTGARVGMSALEMTAVTLFPHRLADGGGSMDPSLPTVILMWWQFRARGAPWHLLRRLLLAADGAAVRRRHHESRLDCRTVAHRLRRKNPARGRARRPRAGCCFDCLGRRNPAGVMSQKLVHHRRLERERPISGAMIVGVPRIVDGLDGEILEQLLVQKRLRLFFTQSVAHTIRPA